MTSSSDIHRTASPTTVAFRNLPADIQALSFDAVGHLPRPMSHMEMLLAVGQAVLAERERDKWEPIDTAPKDGTPVVLANFSAMCLLSGAPHVWTARYLAEAGMWAECSYAATNENGDPTHWQPLPSPPGASE